MAKIDIDFLWKPELEALRLRSNLIADTGFSDLYQRRLKRYLNDPFIRPMLEIELNGVIHFEAALTLISCKFLRLGSFKIRSGPARHESLEYVEFTSEGAAFLNSQTTCIPTSETCFDTLCGAIQSYYAIDHGNGLVGTRDALEAALEIEDGDFLSRIVRLPNGVPALPQGIIQNLVTDSERLEMSEFWDHSGEKRSGAGIIDLRNLAQE